MTRFNNEMKEDIESMKKELKNIREQSVAYEMVREAQRQSKRFFIIWIITFIAFIGLIGYTIYLLNDIEYVETTENETYEVEQNSGDGGNNNFINGNDNEVNNG